MFFSFFKKISGDIAIDLGTANTLIYVTNKGIMINEPSIVSKSVATNKIIAVGNEAKAMLGRTNPNVTTIRPLKDGVIADFEMTDGMLRGFIKKMGLSRFARPRMVICIPSGITEVEKRAVRDSAEQSNARQVLLVEEPVAAAIGMGIDISKPIGNMIVDIGGGTTEIAVIALNGVVSKESIRMAGDKMNNDIIQYFRKKYNLLIGEKTAEDIKISAGSVSKNKRKIITIKGRNLVYGIPKTVEVSSSEIAESLEQGVMIIINGIKKTLEKTPPELSTDILDRGIILTGGGALLDGLDKLISKETGLPVHVAENPLLTVVQGTGKVLENVKLYQDIIV